MRYISAAIVGSLTFYPVNTLAFPSFAGYSLSSDTLHRSQSSWRRFTGSVIDRLWKGAETQSLLSPLEESRARDGPSGKLIASYGQDVVLRFTIDTEEEATSLAEAANDLFLDVWDFNSDWVDIRITKDVVPSLLGLLPASLQTKHVALLDNLDLTQAIFDTYPSPSTTAPHDHHRFRPSLEPSLGAENIFFKNYQPLSVIVPWMSLLTSMFPTHARLLSVGTTYEGRDIPALLVGAHPSDSTTPSPRKTILLTGGLHAREWISTSTITYLAWSLITRYGKDDTTTGLVESFDWIFVPTLNPDGYIYTWDTDRLWRKNRQPTSLRFCRGIDLDRAFAFHWDGASTQDNPCSESYAGAEPFEAVEAARFAAWARNETDSGAREFVALLDLHSYSQQVLYPYSYSCADEPPTVETLEELALGLAKAIRVSRGGRAYTAVAACEGNVAPSSSKSKNTKKSSSKDKSRIHPFPRIESGGGSALDYFYHELHVRYAFQVKLRDTGSYGFLLPKENILPTGREMLEAVLYLGRFLAGDVGLAGEEDGEESQGEGEGDGERGEEKEEEEGEDGEVDGEGDADTWTDEVADDQPDWEQAFVEAQLKDLPTYEDVSSEDESEIGWELRRRRKR